MAPFSNFISFLFLTTLLLLSLQIDARDSQFFSKVTHVNNYNNVKETELPNNEGPVNKPEQQPVFIPETENNYGLYGHESGLKPPSTTTTNEATTTTYQPYKTELEETSKFSNNKDSYSTNQDVVFDPRLAGNSYGSSSSSSNNNNNHFYNNNDAYRNKQNELSDTQYYTEGGYNSMENQNNNNNQKYYYNKNNGANDRSYFYNNYNNGANDKYFNNNNGANNKYYGERQGLSDTRFMEGGKYFYDVNSEKYNPTVYGGGSARGVNTENWYNNRGYFGQNNNANSYENKNSMEGFQNHAVFEDEQENFEP